MSELIKRGRQFCLDTISEMKKCSWPPKKQLVEQTILVIVSVALLALFVAAIDAINIALINFLTLK